MQYKLFQISCAGNEEMEEEFNTFLRSHRIVSVVKELVNVSGIANWCFCVEYLDLPASSARSSRQSNKRIDYKEILSEEDFAVYARLRDVRFELSQKEAVPVYAICTNEQLAIMAKDRPTTLSDFKKIDGIGEAKADKYGQTFLNSIPKRVTERKEAET